MNALQSSRSFGKRGPGSLITLCEDSLTPLGLFTRLLRLWANVYGLLDCTGRSSVGSHKWFRQTVYLDESIWNTFTSIYRNILELLHHGCKDFGAPEAPLHGLTLGMGNWQDPEQ